MIRVALIDEIEVIRFGIQRLLSSVPHIEFLGAFSTIDFFYQDPAHYQTDVLLLEQIQPIPHLHLAIRQIQTFNPPSILLLLAAPLEAGTMRNLFQLGVLGFIYKDEPLSETLVPGIHRVYEGKRYLSPEAALIPQHADLTGLTPRALQILRLLAQGLGAQQIAQELSISTRAVYAARTRLRDALGVRSDAQVVAEAIRLGLLNDR